jgi:DHA1 family multidrug resistance protein-like MFS transporter
MSRHPDAPTRAPRNTRAPGTDRTPAQADRLVRGLSTTVFLQWFGASAIIPMLPEYIRQRGGSDGLAGVVMAAFFAAGVVSQYPAGRLADRIGRRPVLLGGLFLYAVASFAFLAPVGPAADIGLRAIQGVGAGAAEVAALAMVSGAVSAARRGKAFASIYGGQLAGMAVGPLVGSLLGVNLMWIVFLSAGIASLAACIPAFAISEDGTSPSGSDHDEDRSPLGRIRLRPALAGSLLSALALGLTFGVYEICWTLLLRLRGASSWQVGLSWTLFAVPFVLMTKPSGWLTDHVDRRRLVVGGLTVTTTMCAAYPFIDNVPVLLALGCLEAVAVALVLPATQSMLVQTSEPSEFGRVQGMFSTSQTAATALSAAVGGALFGLAAWAPFVTVASLALVIVVAVAVVWRKVDGTVKAHEHPVEVPVG